MGRTEAAHGLDPVSRFPKIYYTPNVRPEFSNTVVVDLSSIALRPSGESARRFVEMIFKWYEYKVQDAVQVQFGKLGDVIRTDHRIPGLAPLAVGSLFEYCDILSSCRALVTVLSGAHALAVATRGEGARPTIHCWCPREAYNRRVYVFDSVEYYVPQEDNRTMLAGLLWNSGKYLWALPRKLVGGSRPLADR